MEATKPWFPTEEGFTSSDWCTFTPWGLKAVRFRADPSDSVGKFKGVREKRVRDQPWWKGMYDYLDVWKPHRLLYILYIIYIIIINYIYIYRAFYSTIRYSIFMPLYIYSICVHIHKCTYFGCMKNCGWGQGSASIIGSPMVWLPEQEVSRKSAGSQ